MADQQSIKARFPDDLTKRWRATLTARKISQQDALTALAAWIVAQDSLVQAIVFGQVEQRDHADLAKMVLKRMAKTEK